jgi:peptide chain release factor subunit 3
MNRYMAYIMDTNEEERAKGKTVEVGRAHFETEKSRFTILDAPVSDSYLQSYKHSWWFSL